MSKNVTSPSSKRATSRAIVLLAAGAMLLSSGCDLFGGSSQFPTPPPGTAPAPNKAAPPVADQDEDKEDNTYRRPEFPANTRRDPFTFRAPEPEVRDEQQARQREPLEAFETNQLRLVAIVTGTAVPEAMFTDPTGFGHFAKEDDRIGRNGGRITDIRENEVEITINPEANLGSDSDIEDEDEDERPPAEPITLIIRLSDTELKLPGSDEAENEEPSILEKIDETPEGSQDGNPPLSP